MLRLFMFLGCCDTLSDFTRLVVKDAWQQTVIYDGTCTDFITTVMKEKDWCEKQVMHWSVNGDVLTVGISLR